jgi:hypothetical protein
MATQKQKWSDFQAGDRQQLLAGFLSHPAWRLLLEPRLKELLAYADRELMTGPETGLALARAKVVFLRGLVSGEHGKGFLDEALATVEKEVAGAGKE